MDRESCSSVSEIEAGLERLMPRGLSEDSRLDLEAVVDNLAGEVRVVPFWKKPACWQSAAAVLILTGLTGAYFNSQKIHQADRTLAQIGLVSSVPDIEILEQKTWIDSGADLGVQPVNESGDLSRGWSYSGVEEERLLHGGTGYEVILQREFEAELYASSSL